MFFVQARENLPHGFEIFLQNRRKYSIFAIFFRNFFANFRKFSGVRGALPPDPLRGWTPYLEPPEIFSCVRHCLRGMEEYPRNRKNCCRKMVLFSWAVLNDKFPLKSNKTWLKINSQLRFSYLNRRVCSKTSTLT